MSESTKWIFNNGIFFPISGAFKTYSSPGPGIFNLVMNPEPMSKKLGLQKIGDKFTFDFKVYDLGIDKFLEKVQKTWNSPILEEKKQNLGIILNGLKGTGKTIAAKILCNMMDIPVIVIPYYIEGMLEFVQSLEFECIIFLDEAEKAFRGDNPEASQILLKMIDGAVNKSRKLYVLTTNKLSVNENMLGRPGRIRYIKSFGNIGLKAINEYINDNLKDLSKKEEVISVVSNLEISTIDTLKAIVEEVNIHGTVGDNSDLNLSFSTSYFNVLYTCYEEVDSEDIKDDFRVKYSAAKKYINTVAIKSGRMLSWLFQEWNRATDPLFDWNASEDDYIYDMEDEDDLPESYEEGEDSGESILDLKSDTVNGSPNKNLEKHYNEEYLRTKFNVYSGTLRLKGSSIKLGMYTENFGTIVEEDKKSGWFTARWGERIYKIYPTEKNKTRGIYGDNLSQIL